jgi:HEAT repeat protein
VRAYAITALGELGDDTDVPALVAAIDDPSRVVALRAGQALRSLGAREELERLLESRRGTDRGNLAGELLSA